VIGKARMMGEVRPRRGKVGDEVEIARDLEAVANLDRFTKATDV
jgi:hypothetical protein